MRNIDYFKSQSISDLTFFKIVFWRKMKKIEDEIVKKLFLGCVKLTKKAADIQSAALSLGWFINYLCSLDFATTVLFN